MAAEKRGVPENSSVIIPRLFCRDPAKEIDFYVNAFEPWSSDGGKARTVRWFMLCSRSEMR